ncbi:hypothetical protein FACS1894132_11290 [Clostridia bacterium]|nr:hypothetical protein FACS1894132_11290 [Clostridia bacterium]
MKTKLFLDVILLLLFAVMCNTDVTGTLPHQVLGLVYTALLAIHLILNRKWVVAFFKGKLRGRKTRFSAILNTLLFIDFSVILVTGIWFSDDNVPTPVILTHIICSIIAAFFILIHVLLHWKVITKNKKPVKVAVCFMLVATMSYSLFGGIQGVLHYELPKDNTRIEDSKHQPKNGERK